MLFGPSALRIAVPEDSSFVTVESLFHSLRWPNGPACPFCGHTTVYTLDGVQMSRRRIKCAACRRQFTVTKGTILENSRLSLDIWFRAARRLTRSGTPPHVSELAEDLSIGRTAARNLLERLRYATRHDPLRRMIDPALDSGPHGMPPLTHLSSDRLLKALLKTPPPTQAPIQTPTDTRLERRVSKRP